jgi:hypothetical protein
MDDLYFRHPNRLPYNADGPFYTTGNECPENSEPNAALVWCGDCLACEAPELEAPGLLAPLTVENIDTYFVRQPVVGAEVDRACSALQSCCVAALRYGGRDIAIIKKLNNDPEFCDYIQMPNGELRLTMGTDGQLLQFAKRIANNIRAQNRRRQKKWWQFWL